VASDSSDASRSAVLGLDSADTLRRREFLLWLACILFVSQILVPPLGLSGEDPQDFPQTLLARSVFFYLGWYAVVALLLASNPNQPITRFEVVTALSLAALNFLPVQSSNWLSTTAVGLFLFFGSRNDNKLKAAATVLLALSFNGYWGPKFFNIFGYWILRADAALVGTALVATQPGIEWHETVIGWPGGHSVLIFSPCSSFHNISLGLLCWVSVTKLFRTSWARGDLAIALAVCATVILLNATRLYLMALSSQHYVYWHGGTGEHLFAWASTMMVLLISLWGAVRLGR
jgi:hypothetical protein